MLLSDDVYHDEVLPSRVVEQLLSIGICFETHIVFLLFFLILSSSLLASLCLLLSFLFRRFFLLFLAELQVLGLEHQK